MTRHRVLILGGGCGGVAAAWALSRTPALRRRFAVTLVQSGWRIGGKGTTGRDPSRGGAVIEHGLHLWLGFYRAAFGMVRDLYDAWESPIDGPVPSLESAFTPIHDVALWGGPEHARTRWAMHFPQTPGRPWDLQPRGRVAWLQVARSWAGSLPKMVRGTDGEFGVLAGLGATVLRGLVRERAIGGEDIWSRMDALDLRDWLRKHGASTAQVQSPPVGALYDLGFAYPDGCPGPNTGQAAAGTALKILLQIFGAYRGAPFWRMRAGMGDTIFAPAWDVLRDRGVDFRLFHHVRHLGLRDDRIERVELGVQALDAGGYDPLVTVGTVRAWPDAPIARRLGAIAAGDLEDDRTQDLKRITLRRGVEFDDVVLAIPSAAHHHFAAELIEQNPRYAAMVKHTHTVATVAGQLWLSRACRELGGAPAPGVATGLPGAFRTWADMSEVLDAEVWRERPAALTYLCSVGSPKIQGMRDRRAAGQVVASQMRAWTQEFLPGLWPGASTLAGAFDEGALHAPAGASPWCTQYARANVADWERYVLSLPGTTQYRLAPDESGFHNLFLAGDWTRNVINGGSVEGAASSGVVAAQSIIARA